MDKVLSALQTFLPSCLFHFLNAFLSSSSNWISTPVRSPSSSSYTPSSLLRSPVWVWWPDVAEELLKTKIHPRLDPSWSNVAAIFEKSEDIYPGWFCFWWKGQIYFLSVDWKRTTEENQKWSGGMIHSDWGTDLRCSFGITVTSGVGRTRHVQCGCDKFPLIQSKRQTVFHLTII